MLYDQNKIKEDYFRTLEISTIVGCPVQCSFCPQKVYVSSYRKKTSNNCNCLGLKEFRIALDNLRGSGVQNILFSGYAENMVNPNILDLIYEAHKRGYGIEVVTTGQGLDKKIIMSLSDIEFVRFAFSVQPRNSKTRPGIRNEIDIWNLIEYAIKVLKNVHIDVVWPAKNKNINELNELNKFAVDHSLHFRIDWHDRAGNLFGPIRDNNKLKPPLYCSRPMVNVLQPDGTLSLCCMDWSLKHIIGNLFKQKYVDIVKGSETHKIHHALQLGELNGILCKYCHYLESVDNNWIPASKRPY